MNSRLLILKCYARKRGGMEPLPALERYDGPLWRVLRKFQREEPERAAQIDVYALTGAFGLISARQPIPWIDQTMAPDRADYLRPAVIAHFKTLMEGSYEELCLGLSWRYLRALQGWESFIPTGMKVTHTDGPMGTKLAQLRAWLYGETWQPLVAPMRLEGKSRTRSIITLAGKKIHASREEVLNIARRGIDAQAAGLGRYRKWYIEVDGQAVSPKWLVSQISGLPVSAFDAADARRVLLALGFEILRHER